ncbi:hypothetical protein [cf. Phormidesmis sp. LEGE 11477]|uniref:hypothetical protein n=1 Tax=cf. Phormidesmis sp. LEGE 11477 TaxID=1828680 RepID=UPI001D13AC15|nr:hypothetical protein [cf. Phormidesmis sp. LEGE 11477]
MNDFTEVLGYKPGDRLYVRALLPKNLSDELAIKQNLKFEIEENGKKRLIPNTRRGYLTVGSWEFVHIRKNKEPAVYEAGLTKLLELNQEGRGIYFVVNPGGEHDSKILEARSVFWECDDKNKAEQIEQAQTSGLPLGAMVETYKSVHCYSPLSLPVTELNEWKKLQERVIQMMDGDAAIRNSSRLMRLPGFDHVRVGEKGTSDERLLFSPVALRHLDKAARCSVELIEAKLPQWDKERWGKEAKSRAAGREVTGQAIAPTPAADNPWDIRNFSQYLDGDRYSQNGWLKVQCPHHGGEGHSGDSLGVNEATGQFTCYGGCDTKDVYRAARELATSRGWKPPQQVEKEEKGSCKKEDLQPQIKLKTSTQKNDLLKSGRPSDIEAPIDKIALASNTMCIYAEDRKDQPILVDTEEAMETDTNRSEFDRQEQKLDQLIRDNLAEGRHFEIRDASEDGYQWLSDDLFYDAYIGDEYTFYGSYEEAKDDAIASLTRVYKEFACTPIGIPIQYRDFVVSQDDPHYTSWWSRGETFGKEHRDTLYGDKYDARESAIASLYREYRRMGLTTDLKDPFEEDEIVSVIRDNTSEAFRQEWAERYTMPEVEAIRIEWAESIKEPVVNGYLIARKQESSVVETRGKIEQVRTKNHLFILDEGQKKMTLKSAAGEEIAEYDIEENRALCADEISVDDVRHWKEVQKLIASVQSNGLEKKPLEI